LFHALVDDFSIYGTALSEEEINKLFTGTLPTALPAADKLMAYWDFNDMPAQGLFVSVSPTPDTTAAAPNLIQVVHADGTTPWDTAKVSLKVDGNAVTADKSKTGSRLTTSYVPSPVFAVKSAHTATLLYDGAVVLDWQFTVGVYTKDVMHDYIGSLLGGAKFTDDKGGHSGQAGDFAMDFGRNNTRQAVHIGDATFLNIAAANDEIAIGGWQKLYQIADSSFFWGISPSSSGTTRGIGTHAMRRGATTTSTLTREVAATEPCIA
ncbi:MAG: hypothetical protein HY674_12900, partial [Chloroflexi bacterium]|nr:hypothetical protein [Chloroflexota bacterium]